MLISEGQKTIVKSLFSNKKVKIIKGRSIS